MKNSSFIAVALVLLILAIGLSSCYVETRPYRSYHYKPYHRHHHHHHHHHHR